MPRSDCRPYVSSNSKANLHGVIALMSRSIWCKVATISKVSIGEDSRKQTYNVLATVTPRRDIYLTIRVPNSPPKTTHSPLIVPVETSYRDKGGDPSLPSPLSTLPAPGPLSFSQLHTQPRLVHEPAVFHAPLRAFWLAKSNLSAERVSPLLIPECVEK